MSNKAQLTANQALESLRKEWSGKIKNQVKGNSRWEGFENRLSDTEEEIKRNWYEARVMPVSEALKDWKEYEKAVYINNKEKSLHVLYDNSADFPEQGSCWVLTWNNLLAGGFEAMIDASNGRVLVIKILREGG